MPRRSQPQPFGNVSCFELATIVLMALRVCNLTDISWWVVFAPFIVEVAVYAALMVAGYVQGKKRERKDKNNG